MKIVSRTFRRNGIAYWNDNERGVRSVDTPPEKISTKAIKIWLNYLTKSRFKVYNSR